MTTTQPRRGVLALVNFRHRAIVEFDLRLPPGLSPLPDVRIVGDEIWVQAASKLVAARYSVNDPAAPPRPLTVTGVSKSAEAAWPLDTAAGYAWISVKDGAVYKLFRSALPRDPPALRRIRATLMRELEREPERYGIRRADGPPLHASCKPSEVPLAKRPTGFRATPVFRCEVRFRDTSRYPCATIVRERLAVDPTHRACRR